MIINSRKALSLLCLSAVLAGCGGGGDLDGNPDVPPSVADAAAAAARPGKVGTLDEARRAVGSLLPLTLDLQLATAAKSGGSAPGFTMSAPPASAKAATSCSGGGTRDDSTQSGVNVGSPYTTRTFTLRRLIDDQCRQSIQSGGETLTVTSSGLSRFGEITEGSRRIGYEQTGESASRPQRQATERRYVESGRTLTDTLLLESLTVNHTRYDNDTRQFDGQRYELMQGQFTGFDNGQAIAAAAVLQQGVSPDARLVVGTLPSGAESVSGLVAIGVISRPSSQSAGCASGTYTLATPVALLRASDSPTLQGQLTITADNRTATYNFSSNGQVEIIAGDGSKTVVSQNSITGCELLE